MIETIIDTSKTASIKSDILGSIFIPSEVTGKLIQKEHPSGSDLWKFESDNDMTLCMETEDAEISNINGHYMVRKRKNNFIYLKCFHCMEHPISYRPEYERIIHGYFYETPCGEDWFNTKYSEVYEVLDV